eukprot:7098507-Prymnesium_polylepis.1
MSCGRRSTRSTSTWTRGCRTGRATRAGTWRVTNATSWPRRRPARPRRRAVARGSARGRSRARGRCYRPMVHVVAQWDGDRRAGRTHNSRWGVQWCGAAERDFFICFEFRDYFLQIRNCAVGPGVPGVRVQPAHTPVTAPRGRF